MDPIGQQSVSPPLTLSAPAPAGRKTDADYEREFIRMLCGTHLIVVQGFHWSSYADTQGLKQSMRRELEAQRDSQHGQQIVVVSRGTTENIGVVYDIARDLGMSTGCIVAEDDEFNSPCHHTFVVDTRDGEWSRDKYARRLVMPQSGKNLFLYALEIANRPGGCGGSLLCFGADSGVSMLAGDVKNAGYEVKVFKDHPPADADERRFYERTVDTMRQQGFKVIDGR
ncbi:hypothetical protein [Pandoraea sp. ISTKB]|uniref:hypothetical protein n=1 Tax=Pandoraea sp. ISTKB TaxID=1586708 RepID=UPI0008477DBE|nr:hypothetical protein [Pandoraea sp. ISTKB]ODP35344.1 hypothetical protein A9762_10240 [Pandoraea sp. ISTKB]